MKHREKKVHITLSLPVSTKFKAQQIANTMGVTVSHLVEGLIEGVQVSSGYIKERN